MSPYQIQFCYVFDVHANSMFTSYIYMACQEGIRQRKRDKRTTTWIHSKAIC